MKTVRIIFSKIGRAKYVSHLDLMRTMTRAMRRAEIPLWYTEGYNRHPYLTFAAPLSLGYEGERESMDIRLEEDMDYGELVSRLNAVLPEGIRAVEATEAMAKVKDLTAATYCMTLHCPVNVMQAVLDAPEILVEKRTKKKTLKTLDIKPYFSHAQLEAAGEQHCVLSVTLPCGSAENINPGLLLSALRDKNGDCVTADVVRKALLCTGGKEFL